MAADELTADGSTPGALPATQERESMTCSGSVPGLQAR